MATASFTWTAWDTTNAWQNLADSGGSSAITYARDATDVAAKFTCGTKSTSGTERARKATSGDTWASIFGIDEGCTITAAQLSAWQCKRVAVAKLSSQTLTVNLIDDTPTTLATLINALSLGIVADGSYVDMSPGTNQTGLSISAANNVRLSIDLTMATSGSSGSASVDTRFDNFTVTITYDSPTRIINVDDDLTAQDYKEDPLLPFCVANVYDVVAISEYLDKGTVEGALAINKYDSLTVAEYQDKLVTIYYLSLYDPLGVSEYTNRFPTTYFMNVYDPLTVSEFVDKVLTIYRIDKYDGLTVQEYQGKLIPSYIIDRYDAASVSESIDKLLPKYFLDVYDKTSVLESIDRILSGYFIAVDDDLTVQEFLDRLISTYYANIADSLTVKEYSEIPSESFVTLSKEDLATIAEFIALTQVYNIDEY